MAFFAVTGMTKNASNNFDDDEVVAAFEELEGYTTSVRVAIALSCTKMILNAVGIYGAVTYKVWAVAASLVGYGIEFLVSLIAFDLFTLLMAGFFAYPHYYLIQEIRSGVMSRETYEQEKFSCCCV
jgi:hypothetical protein